MNAQFPRPGVPVPSGTLHRFMAAGLEAQADGVLKAALSSETPVERFFGTEILVHSPEAVNLTRAAMGLPLLLDHDTGQQVGRVENIRLEGRRLVGDIRLTDRADMAGIVADVRSGLRPDISIGYTIEASENGPEQGTVRALQWTLVEVSSVAVPADHTVGFGRSKTPVSRKVLSMNSQVSVPSGEVVSVQAERQRVQNIRMMAESLKVDQDLVSRAIDEGWSFDAFANSYRSSMGPARAISFAEDPAGDTSFHREKLGFSITRAIADFIDKGRLTGREAEVSQELIRRNGGMGPKGFFIPTAVLSHRAQLVGTANIGGNLVGSDYHPEAFIPPLRNRSAVMQLGATVLPDLVGNAVLPRQDNALGGTWVAEDAAATETTLNFSQVTLTPKTVTGNISWSRQAALQALPAMEEIVRNDISSQLAIGLDRAAIAGVGSAVEPRGVLNTAGIGSVALGTNGAAPDYAAVLALEAAVANASADFGALGYLTNSKVRKVLKGVPQFVNTGTPVWGTAAGTGVPLGDAPLGLVNGYPAAVSNNVPSNLTKGTASGICSAMIFGNWQDLVIGLWGATDLIVDPYSMSDKGRVRITGFLSADISVKHAASFAALQDALA